MFFISDVIEPFVFYLSSTLFSKTDCEIPLLYKIVFFNCLFAIKYFGIWDFKTELVVRWEIGCEKICIGPYIIFIFLAKDLLKLHAAHTICSEHIKYPKLFKVYEADCSKPNHRTYNFPLTDRIYKHWEDQYIILVSFTCVRSLFYLLSVSLSLSLVYDSQPQDF